MLLCVRTSAVRPTLIVGLTIVGAATARIGAQPAVITGRVTSQTSLPVSGALIAIPRLQLSTQSNDAGVFRLTVPADRVTGRSDTLRVARIGYRPRLLPFNLTSGPISLDVQLAEQAIALEQVVVTGTAGNQERRAQAATVATVDASRLTQVAPIANVQQVIQGRIPGVTVTQATGSVGSTSLIRIRGISSISLTNDPLVFVDGVRLDNTNLQIGGGAAVSSIGGLDPNEIESIEVVKGPAAATLYGSDASTGVIQIITKRGRAGTDRFTQTLSLEYARTEPDWTPPANFAACTAANVAANSPSTLCRGQAVGTVVSDNPIVRGDLLKNGRANEIGWQGRGGGSNYGYFLSYTYEGELATVPQNGIRRQNARTNFTVVPNQKLTLDGGVGITRDINDQVNVGDNFYGLLTALLGSPLTVGLPVDGWLTPNITGVAVSNIITRLRTTRVLPNVQFQLAPVPWFTHRLVLGGDISRVSTQQFFPKNANTWFLAQQNLGQIQEVRNNVDTYTLDYRGNVKRSLGTDNQLEADLSFGTQLIARSFDQVSATGFGLAANSSNTVSAATTISATGTRNEQHFVGYLAQLQLGLRDRLFAQFGMRIDQNSAVADSKETFFLPKVGLSYVLSEEPFFTRRFGFVNTLRLRAAYGTTGRSPQPGSALQTYGNAPFVLDNGTQAAGVVPQNPGNVGLRAERGTELEGGVDLALFEDRVGLEVTYFNKRTKDLLLARPIPPSLGFTQNPFVNVGEVSNKGVEISLRAALVTMRNVALESRLNVATLHNELTSLGGIPPIVTGLSGSNQYREGLPLAAFFSPRVKSVDVERGVAIVSDTIEFGGTPTPKYTGTFSSDLTLFRDLRLSGLLEFRGGHKLYNVTEYFREKAFTSSERYHKRNDLPAEERLRLYGPYVNSRGQPVAGSLVIDDYLQDGSFVRFRELSATYTLPVRLAQHVRSSNASLTVGGRNLALWTDYRGGWDPESITYVPNNTGQFFPFDFLTMPQPQRWYARLSLGF